MRRKLLVLFERCKHRKSNALREVDGIGFYQQTDTRQAPHVPATEPTLTYLNGELGTMFDNTEHKKNKLKNV